ncbi:hypothetical protein [Burkholderia sp. PU8-34]
MELRGCVDAWSAIGAAFSSVPPFRKYVAIPVARSIRFPIFASILVAATRRRAIAQACPHSPLLHMDVLDAHRKRHASFHVG